MNQYLKAIIKREFQSYINSPIAYIIIAPFLLIISFLYYRSALVVGDANLRPFIELLPWFLIVITPAFTMRAFSKDDRNDPLELLFAHPASEWTIVLGKFLGAFLFYLILLAGTLMLPLTIIVFSTPDIGMLASQYLATMLVGALFLSTSLAVATYVGNSIGSFLAGTFLNLVLVLLGMNFVVLMAPGIFGRFISELSVTPHINNLSRGVIDFRDILYFATIISIALAASVLKLSERKVQESAAEKSKLNVTLGLIVAIGLVGNIFMSEFPIRLDATQSRQFSVSKGAKQLLRQLPDRVNIELYASSNLPGPLQGTLREASDRLKDLKRYSDKVNVSSTLINPEDQQARNQALDAGIREVQFNQIGTGSFQVQTGFLGLRVRYADQVETIDFIDDASNLEYQLARLILKLTRDERPSIGLVDVTSTQATSVLNSLLSQQYDVTSIDPLVTDNNFSDLSAIIVIDDASSENATIAAQLTDYITNQGNVGLFIDGVNVNQQILSVTPSTSAIKDILKDKGITLNTDIVYDFQLNQALPFGQDGTQYLLPYPFWPRPILAAENVPWNANLSNVLLAWSSSITLDDNTPIKPKSLLLTSQAANRQTTNYALQPDDIKNLTPPSGETLVLAASIESQNQHLAVVADSNIVSDELLNNVPENTSFAANLIDWVAADEILQAIPQRSSGRSLFVFASELQVQIVQYANLLLPPIATTLFGVYWLSRRKKNTRKTYTS